MPGCEQPVPDKVGLLTDRADVDEHVPSGLLDEQGSLDPSPSRPYNIDVNVDYSVEDADANGDR